MKNSKNQFPAQTGTYAVKVKSGNGWRAYSTARFQISVGQEYHEGDKFLATMQWAAHRFDKVVICVNDTLQRYNYMHQFGLSELEAKSRAETAGREWIERNIQAIRALPSCEIYRWDQWLGHTEFCAEHESVLKLYHDAPEVRELIQADVFEFWKRRKDKSANDLYADFARFKKFATAYLLEETAAFFLMFKKENAVDIYPGSTLLPCVLAEKYLDLSSRNLGLCSFTRIDFLRRQDSDISMRKKLNITESVSL